MKRTHNTQQGPAERLGRWGSEHRVKAILLAALKLPPEERAELAQTLMDTLGADPAEACGRR